MAKVVWTDGALRDLDEIADYVAKRNADAANRLVRQVLIGLGCWNRFQSWVGLSRSCQAGCIGGWSVGPVKVIYRLERGAAFIEMVVRGERLLTEQLLKQRKF